MGYSGDPLLCCHPCATLSAPSCAGPFRVCPGPLPGGALGTRCPRCSWLACPTARQLPGNRLRLTPSPPQIQPAPRSPAFCWQDGRGEPGQARRRRAFQPGWRARSPAEGAGGGEQMASLGGGTQRLAPGSLLNSVRTHVSDRRPLGGAVAGTWDH